MRNSWRLGFLGCSLLAAACSGGSGDPIEGEEGSVGQVKAALKTVSPHDVASVHYKVVSPQDGCSGAAIAETTVALEEENLPPGVQPPGSGDSHRFADALFSVPSGNYLVCATPLTKNGEPSAECAQASIPASVFGSMTTEVVLVSQCLGDPSGGLDGVTVLNDPPQIEVITIDPSKFITACENADISVKAGDVNGDSITNYVWSIISGPAGASLAGSDGIAVFSPGSAGDYQLSVTVSDIYNAQTSLTFPIHVSPCECGPLFTETFADNSQGWTLGPDWQIGPTAVSFGQVYGNPDPAEDHTPTADNGVAGVVLGGNAPTNLHDYYYLTSPVVDASGAKSLSLNFWRWLNSDYVPYMQNSVEVFDGAAWVTIWQSGGPPGVLDSAWTEQTLDISAFASPSLQVRFGFTITSSGVFTVSSWNVDDVTITDNDAPSCDPTEPPTVCNDPTTEVELDGHCYYLDGSNGQCDNGFALAPQSVLNTIAPQFVGKNYRHQVSQNCCIVHSDQSTELQDWGMNADCNASGPFVQGPVLGGALCTDANNNFPGQLTLCGSL